MKTTTGMNIKDYIEENIPQGTDHFYMSKEELETALRKCWKAAQQEYEHQLSRECI